VNPIHKVSWVLISESYKILNLNLDIKFKKNSHLYDGVKKYFPKIVEVKHKGDIITELIDRDILESIQSDLYKKINSINSVD
jgi:hypothetical protein